MNIVITSQSGQLDSPVDSRFGRAACFALVNTDTGECTAHDNAQNLNAVQGAGIQAARTVAELGAEAVVTGHVGPKAFATLQAGGIAVYTGATGTVAEALEQFRAGKLSPAEAPDVEGHWV